MIDFDKELEKFHLSLEVEDTEEAIYKEDLNDMTDVLKKLMQNETTKKER